MELETARFDNDKYWSERTRDEFSLAMIGYKGLGLKYNEWLYRRRGEILMRVVEERLALTKELHVIELGVGSGFYAMMWQGIGVKNFVGVDITQNAVDNLSKLFPAYSFYKFDVSAVSIPLDDTFDIVTLFDVLFHIVDDRGFENAIRNASSLMREQALALVSDSIFDEKHFTVSTSDHFKPRSIQYYESILKRNHLKLVNLIDVFSFMHPRVIFRKDSFRSVPSKIFNRVLVRTLMKFPGLGDILGFTFYWLDRMLAVIHYPGRSTKLLLIKKESN